MEGGLVEIYTGNGKGKTTAAIGLAIRAAGWGMNVAIVHFMKVGGYGESRAVRRFKNITERFYGFPYFITMNKNFSGPSVLVYEPGKPPAEYVRKIMNGFKWVRRALNSGRYDVIILDELITAIYLGLIDEKIVLELVNAKPRRSELVITGRYASQELIDSADLVTEMKEVKHPYSAGVAARKGIEF
ncbi:MAG: cob(I)yrinic acid a,c-diamide adenosyltransferase [Nitrososphaeria archaeon]